MKDDVFRRICNAKDDIFNAFSSFGNEGIADVLIRNPDEWHIAVILAGYWTSSSLFNLPSVKDVEDILPDARRTSIDIDSGYGDIGDIEVWNYADAGYEMLHMRELNY